MATLSAAQRKRIPKSKFGLPGKAGSPAAKAKSGNYPMEDKGHAVAAKARATQQVKKGNLSPSAAAEIKARANRVLGKGTKRKGTPGGSR